MPSTFAAPYLQTQPTNPYLSTQPSSARRYPILSSYPAINGKNPFLKPMDPGQYYGGGGRMFGTYTDLALGTQWERESLQKIADEAAQRELAQRPPAPPDFQRNVLYPEIAAPATALAKSISAGPSLTPDYAKLATDYKAASDTALKSYDTAGLETEVRGLQKSNETAQGDVLSKFSDSNARYAQETKDALARLTAQLDKTEANIRTQAGAASSLAGSVARFPGVGGGDTITANNAGLAPRIARATYLPQLAAEERIGNLRYGQIENIEMPADLRLYQNDQGLLSFTSALNDKFRGDRFQIASFLNDVKTRMAAMPLQLQENYANYVLKLIGGEQAIAAGQLSNLSAAQRLIAASEFLERNIPEPAVSGLNSYPVSSPGQGTARQSPNITLDDVMRLLAQQRGNGQPAASPSPVASYPSRVIPSDPFGLVAHQNAQNYIYTPQGREDYFNAYGSYPVAPVAPRYVGAPVGTGGGMINGRWFGNDPMGNPYVNTPGGGVSVNPETYPLDYFPQ